jgi:hypothetical protein
MWLPKSNKKPEIELSRTLPQDSMEQLKSYIHFIYQHVCFLVRYLRTLFSYHCVVTADFSLAF